MGHYTLNKNENDMGSQTPLIAIQQYIDAFNRGDTASMAALFDDHGQILDGLPPHAWHGSTATLDWYRDVMAEGKAHGASAYFVTIGDPLHNDVSKDSA